MTDEKAKLLEAAISQIEKSYGKGSIMRLGSKDVLVPVNVIPSGCLSIDAALGVGGFPRGRVIEIYGPESGGKTTMTLHVIAEAQKLGGQAAFIDAEHALDPNYARKLGVDVDNLLVSLPAAWTLWWWTRWRRWCRRRNLKATWAIRKWACRRA